MGALEISVERFGRIPEFDEGQTVQNEGESPQDNDQCQQQVVVGQVAAGHPDKPHTERQCVDAVDGLALVVLEMAQKTMMDMALVGGSKTRGQICETFKEGRFGVRCVLRVGRRGGRAEDAAPDGQADVDDGYAAGQKRDADGDDGNCLRINAESRDGEKIADEHGPRVPHEETRGMPIKIEESQQGGSEDGQQASQLIMAKSQRGRAQAESGDDADTGG